MPFDAVALHDELTALFGHIARIGYDVLPGPAPRSDQVLELRYFPVTDAPLFIHAHTLSHSGKSSHRQLVEAQFKTDCETYVNAIRDLIFKHIPALDNKFFDLEIELRTATEAGAPRFRFKLNDHKIAASPVQISTIVKKVVEVGRNLITVPKAGSRVFIVETRKVPAVDAYAAMRVHCALAKPEFFHTPPEVTPRIDIAEKLDHEPFLFSIFSQAESND